jgi:hypothetical protein
MKMEAAWTSETVTSLQNTTRYHNPAKLDLDIAVKTSNPAAFTFCMGFHQDDYGDKKRLENAELVNCSYNVVIGYGFHSCNG